LVSLALIATIFLLDWAQLVVIPILLAIVLAYALNPLVTRLCRWHLPRVLGTVMVLLLLTGALAGLGYASRGQIASMIESLPEAAQQVRASIKQAWRSKHNSLDSVRRAADQIGLATRETLLRENTRGSTHMQVESQHVDLGNYLWTGTVSLASLVGLAAVVWFLTFFLLAEGDGFRRKLVRLVGPGLAHKKVTVQMLDEISTQVQRYLLIQVLGSLAIGIVTWLVLWAIGLDNPAVWGLAAAIFNLVPYLGALIIVIGTALLAFLQFGTFDMALLVAGVSALIQAIKGYWLLPWLTGRACRMNPVMVFVSMIFWGWLWGVWGLILGLPVMIAVKSVADRVEALRPVSEFMAAD
jgi:predicted PurR-regulated permease PerM